MNTIKLPRADWDWILMSLRDCEYRGPITEAIIKDINTQLDGQEY